MKGTSLFAAWLLRGPRKPYTLNSNRLAAKTNGIIKVVMRNHEKKNREHGEEDGEEARGHGSHSGDKEVGKLPYLQDPVPATSLFWQ